MIQKAIEHMKNLGFKNTPRRRAVLELFVKEHIYLNPLEVRARLERAGITTGIPSVYRILEELCEAGILRKTDNNERYLYYYFCFPSDKHHHHFFCSSCRKVIHLNHCFFKENIDSYAELEGCEIEKHTFSIEGLCRTCNQ